MFSKKFLSLAALLLTTLSYSCENVLLAEGDPFPSDIHTVHPSFADDTTDAVVVAILNEGKCLFGQRGNESSSSNSWGLIGGKIDPGESPIIAAKREIKEELGIDIENFEWVMTRLTLDEGAPKNKFFRVFILRANYEGELSSQEPLKVQNLKWMPIGEFPTPVFPPSEEYLLDLMFKIQELP